MRIFDCLQNSEEWERIRKGDLSSGIFLNTTFEDYCEVPAMNASTLVYGLKSPKHLLGAIEGRFAYDSPALEIGRILHALVEGQVLEFAILQKPSRQRDRDRQAFNVGNKMGQGAGGRIQKSQ